MQSNLGNFLPSSYQDYVKTFKKSNKAKNAVSLNRRGSPFLFIYQRALQHLFHRFFVKSVQILLDDIFKLVVLRVFLLSFMDFDSVLMNF